MGNFAPENDDRERRAYTKEDIIAAELRGERRGVEKAAKVVEAIVSGHDLVTPESAYLNAARTIRRALTPAATKDGEARDAKD